MTMANDNDDDYDDNYGDDYDYGEDKLKIEN